MSAGIFRYINFKRLLEIEGGFTTNEPTQLCVTAAIQKAVICLVVEGLADGLWSLKDPTKMSDPDHPGLLGRIRQKAGPHRSEDLGKSAAR